MNEGDPKSSRELWKLDSISKWCALFLKEVHNYPRDEVCMLEEGETLHFYNPDTGVEICCIRKNTKLNPDLDFDDIAKGMLETARKTKKALE